MNISAKISGIKYCPLLCRKLPVYDFSDLSQALATDATFILNIDRNQIAVSWWRSAKRTRSYPYARVYDSLAFAGRKVTIIPIFKDEGKDGDRDFLQFDTVSLMSLLGIYVVIAYYQCAVPSGRYSRKITDQTFDVEHIKSVLSELLSYQSDALHWNLVQTSKAGELCRKALDAYTKISERLGIEMHSFKSAEARITELTRGKDEFLTLSRKLAGEAQRREFVTIQPKENLSGEKANLTISNYLGGYYYFTVDEARIADDNIYLVEGKHSRTHSIPSLSDIKDGLIKMILFTNLRQVLIGDRSYNPIPVLKLTVENGFNSKNLSAPEEEILRCLNEEAKVNSFKVLTE